jgi:putative restriction endonuclease
MPAYWLTFKPLGPTAPRGWPIENIRDLVERFEADPATATEWWRIAAHQSANVGDRVYLFKQGDDPRGIFGVGTIIDGPEHRGSPSDQEGVRPRALIRFEKLVDPTEGFLLRLDEIDDIVPLSNIVANASGISVREEVVSELEKRLAPWLTKATQPIDSDQADDAAFDPASVADERQRALRAIRIRRGQPAFRAALLEAYGKRCAITGCAIEDVLEAAHITPHWGPLTNHVSNGLLLRTDIHTLFDCGLLAIQPDTRRVVIAEALKSSVYAKIADRPVRPPRNRADGPSAKNLQRRFAMFEALQKRRA